MYSLLVSSGKSGPNHCRYQNLKGGAFQRLKTDTYMANKRNFLRYNKKHDVEDWIYHIEDAEIIAQNKII